MSNETTEKRRGRPVVADSARQAKLAAKQEKLSNGEIIARGRPTNPESKRQTRLAAQAARAASGLDVKVGRPKGTGKKVEGDLREEVVTS